MTYDDIVPMLLKQVPEFLPDYGELMKDFGDESGVGAHVVFGALFQFFLAHCQRAVLDGVGSLESGLVASRLAAFLETAAAASDEEVRSLIQVSFMGHMWQASSAEREYICSLLGPASMDILRLSES